MVYVDSSCQDEGDWHTGTRVCTGCGLRQPMAEFYWANGRKCRRRRCKSCVAEDRRTRYLDPEYRASASEAGRYNAIRRKYGLTREDMDRLEAESGGMCAICKRGFGGQFHVDHCHKSGKVRGLLCFTCNTALGKFMDDIDVLESAIAYLRERGGGVQ